MKTELLARDLSVNRLVRFSRDADDAQPGATKVVGRTETTVTLYTGHLWTPMVLTIQPDGTVRDTTGVRVYLWAFQLGEG